MIVIQLTMRMLIIVKYTMMGMIMVPMRCNGQNNNYDDIDTVKVILRMIMIMTVQWWNRSCQ